jgi:enoyl-CoA hydratase
MRVTREMPAALAVDPNTDGGDGIRTCYGSRDFAEGVRAFLDRRPAARSGA